MRAEVYPVWDSGLPLKSSFCRISDDDGTRMLIDILHLPQIIMTEQLSGYHSRTGLSPGNDWRCKNHHTPHLCSVILYARDYR